MSGNIKTIGVLSSGGDAPGMNAGIRAVVRCALNNGIKVKGIHRGFNGLLDEDMFDMNKESVSNIINVGGTILFTARSKEFMTEEGQKKAYNNCIKNGIDALVILGGDGSFNGALKLSRLGLPVMGIPATIDLDIACSEYTIGFDTAVNTAMESVDKIRDTSTSHERCSIIEVMGRRAGYIAVHTGIATGAEEILIPEDTSYSSIDSIITRLKIAMKKGKKHYIIINAEGIGNSYEMATTIEKATGIETRATILGYLQRGGSPTCKDRVFASMMGVSAVELLIKNIYNKLIIVKNGTICDLDIEEGLAMKNNFPNIYLDTVVEVQSK